MSKVSDGLQPLADAFAALIQQRKEEEREVKGRSSEKHSPATETTKELTELAGDALQEWFPGYAKLTDGRHVRISHVSRGPVQDAVTGSFVVEQAFRVESDDLSDTYLVRTYVRRVP